MRHVTLILLASLLAFTGGALAEEDLTIDDLNLGTWWYGPQVTTKDLAGKVVLVEMWGS